MGRTASKAAKPVALGVIEDAIPDELKTLPRWVCWKYVRRGDKWDKTPLVPGTRQYARITRQSATCYPYKTAIEAYLAGGCDGVGFLFAKADPYIGVDLDDCRDPVTGQIKDWAEYVVKELDSYTEASPSGTGVKIFVVGTLPAGARKKHGDVEIYASGRFFTVTGQHLTQTPPAIEARQEALIRVHGRHVQGQETPHDVVRVAAPPSDEEVLKRAMLGPMGEKFSRLWNGDITGYDSHSEADIALCGMLAYWTGPDPEGVERLFGQSGLGQREKWVKRPGYRDETVRTAIGGQQSFFRWPVSTREDMRIQENPGMYTQAGPPDAASVELIGPGAPNMGITAGTEDPEEHPSGAGQGVAPAVELAQSLGQTPVWEASFALARRLRAISAVNPEQFEAAAMAFCGVSGHDPEEFFTDFLIGFEKVRVVEGDGGLVRAFELAKRTPYPLIPCPGPVYAQVGSVAYHLGLATAPDPFWLPQPQLATLIGTYPRKVSRAITLLEKKGVIKCVDENYSFREKRAKSYMFIGDQPAVALPVAG